MDFVRAFWANPLGHFAAVALPTPCWPMSFGRSCWGGWLALLSVVAAAVTLRWRPELLWPPASPEPEPGPAPEPAQPKPEPEPEPEPRPLPLALLHKEGTVVLLRREPGWWAAPPRSPNRCLGKLQAARLRLLLCFLQHERLAEHCPVALEGGRMLETIGGCFVALDLSSDAFWEEAGRAAGLSNAVTLATIRAACTHQDPTMLNLSWRRLGDAGAAVVGTALGAMDAPLPFERIDLCGTEELTAAGMRSIAEGMMGRGLPNLRAVNVSHNDALGDGEVVALAEALAECASLEELYFGHCGVGSAGFEALAAQVPRWPRLRVLGAANNPGPSDALGRALAAALPSLPDAKQFQLPRSRLGEGAAAELRAAKAAWGSAVTLVLEDDWGRE
eukprot:COSAG04_NODE_3279_length_2980_cov_1.509198_1_plen_389_part_00